MSKEDLVFPGEPVEWVKDPSALEFPEVPRAQTEGVKHDLEFPEGEEAQESKSLKFPPATAKGTTAQEPKNLKAAQDDAKGAIDQETYMLTLTRSEAETLEEPLEVLEERRSDGSRGCASPCHGWVFARRPAARPLTAVAALALVGLALAAVRPSAGRVVAVPLVVGAVVSGVVACGARYAR